MKRNLEFRLAITGGIIGLLFSIPYFLPYGLFIALIFFGFTIIMSCFVLKIDHQIYACFMIFIGSISFILMPFLRISGILFIISGALAFRKPKSVNEEKNSKK